MDDSDARDDEAEKSARLEEAWRLLGLTPDCKSKFTDFVNSNRATPSCASSPISRNTVDARNLTGEPTHSTPSTSAVRPTDQVFKTSTPAQSNFAPRNKPRSNSLSRVDSSSKSIPVAPHFDCHSSSLSRSNSPLGSTPESPKSPAPKRKSIVSPSRQSISPPRQSAPATFRYSQYDFAILKASVIEYYKTFGKIEHPRIIERRRAEAQSRIESCFPEWDVPYCIDSRVPERSDDSFVPTQTNAQVPPMPAVPGTAEIYIRKGPEEFVDAEDVIKSMEKFEEVNERSSLFAHDEVNRCNRDWRTGKHVPTKEEKKDFKAKKINGFRIFSHGYDSQFDPDRAKSTKEKIEETKMDNPDIVMTDQNAEYDGQSDEEIWSQYIKEARKDEVREVREKSPEFKEFKTSPRIVKNALYYQFMTQGNDENAMKEMIEKANEEAWRLRQEDQDFYEKPKFSAMLFNRHTFRERREDSPSPPLKKNREFCNKIDCKLYYGIPLNKYEQEVHDEWREIIPTGEFKFPYPPREYMECCQYKNESFFYTMNGGRLEPIMFSFKVHPAMSLYSADLDMNEFQRQMLIDLAKQSEVPNARNNWTVEKPRPKNELTPEQQAEYDALPEFNPFFYYEHRPGEEEEWVVRPRSPSRMPQRSKRQIKWKEPTPEPQPAKARTESPEISIVRVVPKPVGEPLTVEIGDYPRWRPRSGVVQPVLMKVQRSVDDTGPIDIRNVQSSSGARLRSPTVSPSRQENPQERADTPMSVDHWDPQMARTSDSPLLRPPTEVRPVEREASPVAQWKPIDLSSVHPVDNAVRDGALSRDRLRSPTDPPTQQEIAQERPDSPMSVDRWEPIQAEPVEREASPVPQWDPIEPSAPIRQQIPQTTAPPIAERPNSPVTQRADSPMSVNRWQPITEPVPMLESPSVVRHVERDASPVLAKTAELNPMSMQTSDSPMLESPAVSKPSPVVAKKVRKPRQPKTQRKVDEVAPIDTPFSEASQLSSGDQPSKPSSVVAKKARKPRQSKAQGKSDDVAPIDTTISESSQPSSGDQPTPQTIATPSVQTSDSTVLKSPVVTKKARKPRQSKAQRKSDDVAPTDKPNEADGPETSSRGPLRRPPMQTSSSIQIQVAQAVSTRLAETQELHKKREEILGADTANELLAEERLALEEFLEDKGLPGIPADDAFEIEPVERMDVDVVLTADVEQIQDKNIPSTSTVARALTPTVQALEKLTEYDLYPQEAESTKESIAAKPRTPQQHIARTSISESEERLLLGDSSTFDEPPSRHASTRVLERSPTPDLLREPSEETTGEPGIMFDPNVLLGETSKSPTPANQLSEEPLLEDALLEEPTQPAFQSSPDNVLYEEMYGVVDDVPMPTTEQERELLDGLDEPNVAPVPIVPEKVETVAKKSRRSRKSVPRKIVEEAPESEPTSETAPGPARVAQEEDVPVVSRTRSKSTSRPSTSAAQAVQVPEDAPVVSRTRSRPASKPAPAPASVPVLQDPEPQAEDTTEDVPKVPRFRSRSVARPSAQTAPGPALQNPEPQAEAVPEVEPVVLRNRSRPSSKPAVQTAQGPAQTPDVQTSGLQVKAGTEDTPVASKNRRKSVSRPATRTATEPAAGPAPAPTVHEPEPQLEAVSEVSRSRSRSIARPSAQTAPGPAPAPVLQNPEPQAETVPEEESVVFRTRSRPSTKPSTQTAPGPAPAPTVQETEHQVTAVPEVSRSRRKSVARRVTATQNAPEPAPTPVVQVAEPQVTEEQPTSKRTRSMSATRPDTEPVAGPAPTPVVQEPKQTTPGPAPAPSVQVPEPPAEAVTEDQPVVSRTRSRPVSKPVTPTAPEPVPSPVVQDSALHAEAVAQQGPTPTRTRNRSMATPAARLAARRAASRKAAAERETAEEPEEHEEEPEEQMETPATRRRRRNEDSPPPEPAQAIRAKRLYLSKNNPTPRARVQVDPNAPSTSTAPPPVVQYTYIQAAPLPAAIRDLMDEGPENQPEEAGPSDAYTPIDVTKIKPEPPTEAWEIPPPISETSRKSKKRKRLEQMKILENMKQESDPDPDFEVTQAYAMGYKKIKPDPDADEELIVEKVIFNLKNTLVALEPECGPAKPIREDGETNPDHKFLATKRLWEEVNQVLLTDLYQFSRLAIFLANKEKILGRVFTLSVPVEDRVRDVNQNFMDFLLKCPKKLTPDQEKYLDYDYFQKAFQATSSTRAVGKKVTSFTLSKLIGVPSAIKQALENDAPSGLIGDAEKDNLQAVERILQGQLITTVIRMAELSAISWATVDHLNRRLEMVQDGWNTFLITGGFLRLLLAIDRDDVKKMSDEFRAYCVEYLEDVRANYQTVIRAYEMDEDVLFNGIIERAGLTEDDLKALDADVRVEAVETHLFGCTDCRVLNKMTIRFSSPELLDKHSLIHSQGILAGEESTCGVCWEDHPSQLMAFHRIEKHDNMKTAERDYDA